MKAKILLAAAALGIAGAAAAALAFLPRSAPEVRFAALSGEQFSTSDLRGKVLLVNFWATWCTTCIQEMPKMIDTYRRFAPRGLEMVAVAVSDREESVATFTKKRALPFKVAMDTDGDIAKQFGRVRITPTSYLIGRDGRILKQYVGEPDWAEFHALVEKALGAQ